MSIIIRLQNLPWAANSIDIRRFFDGLSIPDGGVHIVGGEKGDAFIAFATDDDARQAMHLDNGKIKDSRIKLLLSSRNEMQRIIEIARNQTLIAQGLAPSTLPHMGGTNNSKRKSLSPDRKRSRSPDRRRDRDRDKSSSKKSSKRRSRSRSPRRRDRDSSRRRDRSVERSKEKERSEEVSFPPMEENSRSSVDIDKATLMLNSNLDISLPPIPRPILPIQDPTHLLGTQTKQNLGFPPLFPIVKSNLFQPNMIETNFNRLGFDNIPMPPNDSFDKRDPPVWQNQTSLPFNLLQMQGSGSMGVDRALINNNMPSNIMNMDRPVRDDGLDSMPSRIINDPDFERDRGASRRNGRDEITGSIPSRATDSRRNESRFRGYCVELRNLPFAVTYREIREFLKGCHMPQDSLTLVEVNGRRTGVGYARVSGERDVQEALRKHKNVILNRRIELTRCDEEEFYDAYKTSSANRNKKPYKSSGEDLVIVLKGLPYSSTEKDIVGFLSGLEVSDVVVQYDQTGKTVGTGYARFSNYDDYKISLTFDGKPLLHRYVEVQPSTIEKMYEASKYSPAPMNRPVFPKTTPVNADMIKKIRSNGSSFAVSLRGLPPNVQDEDIKNFFSQVKIVPQAVHIMVNPNGLPSGDAFAEFNSVIDLEVALKQDEELIGGRHVKINPIALDQMHDILGRPQFPVRPPLLSGPGPSRGFDMEDKPMGSRPFLMDERDMNGPIFPGPPAFGRPRGPIGMGPPMGANPPFPMMGPRFPNRPILRAPIPDNFGKPGCVIAARNISFRAKDVDILDLFKSYNIQTSNIIRRFDNMGNVTGDARIDFNSPEDANRAITEFSGKMFLGRNIILSKP